MNVLPEISLIPIIVLACLVVGFVLKKTEILNDGLYNRFIPLILAVLGGILGAVIFGLHLDPIVNGAISGIVSTGLHQAFKAFIDTTNKG